MTVLVETITLPERGKVDVRVEFSADIHITAINARRLVTRYVTHQIADLLHAESPDLVWCQQGAFWRVPVMLSTPSKGLIGQVGSIDVDVQSGDLTISNEIQQKIEVEAERLAVNAAL